MTIFATPKYESDSGSIHLLRMTTDYAAAAGAEPMGDVNSALKPKITKADREFGLRPRGVRLVRTIGTAPDQFKKYTFLAVLTAAAFNSATFNPGATVTIGSTAYTVVERIAEDF